MKLLDRVTKRTSNEQGIIGYAVAWWLGVPVTLLILFYLFFGR
jgi:hypothetical protein